MLGTRSNHANARPAKLLRQLRQAAIELDTGRTRELIEHGTKRNASLGVGIEHARHTAQLPKALKFLEKVHSQSGQRL